MINTGMNWLIFEMMSGTNTHSLFYKVAVKLLPVTILLLFLSCHTKREDRVVERSFYYWKSVLKLSDAEKQRLEDLHIKTLYVKFFDVSWNETSNTAIPVAALQATNFKLPKGIAVIPVVFITNECIQKIDSSAMAGLAANVYTLIKVIRNTSNLPNNAGDNEIQIDCDWTASTKTKYFKLLDMLSNYASSDSSASHCSISCTIRLHQIKYSAKTGVPPVKKGLLMCYNMGNLKNLITKNSILETGELKKYLGNLASYPLALDVALPLFEWKVLFRNNIYSGLIENLPDSYFNNSFALQKENRLEILKDTLLQGYTFKKGDIIRNEKSDYTEVLSAAGEVSKRLKNTTLRVSLYHLDSVILNKYSFNEMETIYNSMR